MREWLLAVVCAVLAVTLAEALTPEGGVKRVGALAGGAVVVLVMLGPLRADVGEAVSSAWREGVDLSRSTVENESLKKLIADKTEAYIVDKGASLGLSCTARVTGWEDVDGWPVPGAIELTGTWTEEEQAALCACLTAELGISAERQDFREVTP